MQETDTQRTLAPGLWIDNIRTFTQMWEQHTGLALGVRELNLWHDRIREQLAQAQYMSDGDANEAERALSLTLSGQYRSLLSKHPGEFWGLTITCSTFEHPIDLRPFWKKPSTLIIEHERGTNPYWWGTIIATLLTMRGVAPAHWPPLLLQIEGLERPWHALGVRQQTQRIALPEQFDYKVFTGR